MIENTTNTNKNRGNNNNKLSKHSNATTNSLQFSTPTPIIITNKHLGTLLTKANEIQSTSSHKQQYIDQLRSSIRASIATDDVKSPAVKLSDHGPAYLVKKQQYLKRQHLLDPHLKPNRYSNVPSRYKQSLVFTTTSLPNLNNKVNNKSQGEDDPEAVKRALMTTSDDRLSIIETDADTISESTRTDVDRLDVVAMTEHLSTGPTKAAPRSFLERFFDRQLGLDDGDSDVSAAMSDEQQRESFVENFFNSSETTSRSRPKLAYQMSTESDVEWSRSPSSIGAKVELLSNVRFGDVRSAKLVLEYVDGFECLSDEAVGYFVSRRPASCAECRCLMNCLECCVQRALGGEGDGADACCNVCLGFEQRGGDAGFHSFKTDDDDKLSTAKLNEDTQISPNLLSASKLLKRKNFARLYATILSEAHDEHNSCFCRLGPNWFRCCIETLYDHVQRYGPDQMPDKIPESFFTRNCCLQCQPPPLVPNSQSASPLAPNAEPVPNQSLTDSKISVDNFWQNFFGNLILESRQNNNEIETGVDEKPVVDDTVNPLVKESVEKFLNSVHETSLRKSNYPNNDNEQVDQYESDLNVILERSPFASNVVSLEQQSKKSNIKRGVASNLNPNRKSVTFIEDPKYGFVAVEIPEWQENLREPLYSKKATKNLPEWTFK